MRIKYAKIFFTIITIVFIAIGTFAILYFMTDLLKSDRQLFWKYAFKNVELVKILSDENSSAQEQWKSTHSYTSEGDLNISITQKTGIQNVDLKTSSKYNNSTDRTYSDVTLYQGTSELLKASYIHNENIYAIYCKDIYEPYYIGIKNNDLKELANKMEIPDDVTSSIPNSISFGIKENASKISEKEMKYLFDTYSKIIINSISEERYTKTEKTNVTINNLRYETNGYQLTLNQDEIKQMLIDILTKAKSDTKTIVILNKLFTTKNQTEPFNVQEKIAQLLGELQTQEFENTTFDIIVYHVGKNITKTKININNEIVISLEIDNSKVNKNNATVAIEGIGENNTKLNMQIAFERQIISGMINYVTNIINNQNGYTIKMNTSLGNVSNDKIENSSKITIVDNDATIEATYYKTIKQANEALDIQQLTDSNAVIINNYPKNQLATFFTGLEEKAEQVFNDKMNQLNIQLSQSEDNFYLIEGIVSSLLTVINANGIPQSVSTLGTTAIALAHQFTIDSSSAGNNPMKELEEQEKATFNANFTKYEGIQSGSLTKELIANVINSNTLYFNEIGKKVEIKVVGNEITKPKGWIESGESDVTRLSALRDKLNIKNEYNISFKKNTSGYIQVITITSK